MPPWSIFQSVVGDPGVSGSALTALLAVHLNIFIYALAFWLQRPVEPFLIESLGGDPFVFGQLATLSNVMMFIGGPIVGRVCDTRGSRLALILTQAGGAAACLLLGTATDITAVYASRLPTLLLHTMHCSQTLVSLLTAEKYRAKSMGRLSLSYGLGMMAGSSLGGFLGERIGLSNVALVASALSLLSIPATLLSVPDFRANEGKPTTATTKASSSSLELAEILRLLRSPRVAQLVAIQLAVGLALSTQRSTFTTVSKEIFQLDAKSIGMVMAFMGCVSTLVNLLVVPRLTAVFSDRKTILGCLALLIASLAVYSMMETAGFAHLLLLFVPMTVASTSMYTVFNSVMSKVVAKEDTGTSIGIRHAVGTLCGIICPSLGGYLFAHVGFWSIGALSSCLAGLGLILVLLCRSALDDGAQEEKEKRA